MILPKTYDEIPNWDEKRDRLIRVIMEAALDDIEVDATFSEGAWVDEYNTAGDNLEQLHKLLDNTDALQVLSTLVFSQAPGYHPSREDRK